MSSAVVYQLIFETTMIPLPFSCGLAPLAIHSHLTSFTHLDEGLDKTLLASLFPLCRGIQANHPTRDARLIPLGNNLTSLGYGRQVALKE